MEVTMPVRISPSYELAAIDAGNMFKTDSGKIYMVIRHAPLYTEVERYYWFDRLFSNAVDRIRRLIRKIKKSKDTRKDSIGPDKPKGPDRKYES